MAEKGSCIKCVINKCILLKSTYNVIRGYREIKRLHKLYGKNTHIIFMRGATGDTYIQLMLLDEYLRQKKISKYVLIGDANGIKGLKEVFHISEYIEYSHPKAILMERAYLFLNGYGLNMKMFFSWSYERNIFNRCRVRMTDRFNFMDTYRYFVMDLNGDINYRDCFFSDSKYDIRRWKKQGVVEGKTVIIAPDANSVTGLSILFWNDIIKELQEKDYTVFVNCQCENIYRGDNIFFSYEESVPLLNYAGYFLALRSGLCDIVSTAKCKKIIVYPRKRDKINCSEHRSEQEFSGLKVMELVAEDDKSLVEISTPLVRNVTDENIMLGKNETYIGELQILKEAIMSNF